MSRYLAVALGLALSGALLLLYATLPLRGNAQAADVTYGERLFTAKGCASCHIHGAIAGSGQFSGGWLPAVPGSNTGFTGSAPDLTHYPVDPDFLRRWLQDPRSVRPQTPMPNLGLQPAEIAALIAFLQGGAAAR